MSSSAPKLSLAEANRKYFDHIHDSYDEKPWFAKVNQLVTNDLRDRLDWVGIPFANTGSSSDAKDVRLLDYACGTGLLSRIYAPYVTVTRGIDVSPNMVATFNDRARATELPESTIHAVVGDLFDKANPSPAQFSGPEWKDFDLAAAGFAFHHFEDVVHAAKCLKERLRPGGALVINDFLEGGDLKADENGEPILGTEGNHAVHHHHKHGDGEDEKKHDNDQHHHHKHGHHDKNDHDNDTVRQNLNASIVTPHFTIEHVRNFFTEAGLVDVDVVTMKERVYMEFGGVKLWRTILFAKGRRPMEEKSEL
ncbi:S-adenosyl-L-methionine-dependent methyltransferase [Lentithecium fluviatile CBS 122367]|uniref:S-adenosyl-L-methionine-dependent methyltransferase n=1 Tax=Lentithecium fluviatile CBS 122367 TaxID=1168545 RepID=A0A6G1JGG1_9PLEO|nr:S-adenosyl-L-methionine-dependent methyltransferase [Lentithecium fluviatile CBS 122367]